MSGKFMMNGIEYLGGGSGGGGGNVDDVYVNGESVLDGNKIAQVTSYKEVTLAEYMALPDTKLTDGIMYCIKDVGGANQFPPLIYSDEEREVGVWRDGKPLYQKTVSFSKDSSWTTGLKSISHGVSNVDYIFIENATAIANNTEIRDLPNVYPPNIIAAGLLIYALSSTDITFYFTNWVGTLDTLVVNVTLRYTKTTDTAGSGTWTTQGGYARHYDNVEKVVGTFFGKPLYERSWTLPSEVTINPSSWTSLGISNTNIDLIVNAIGTSEWGISRVFSVSSKVDNANLVALCTRGGNDTLKYITLQYTKTTD